MPTSAKATASNVSSSKPVQILARGGYAANGVLHILIGFLAISVAWGGGGNADQSGALGAVAANPGGVVLLWLMTVGLFALALWSVTQAFLATESDTKKLWAERAKDVGKAIAYGAIGATALRFAMGGGGGSGDQDAQSLSAQLLQSPFGVVALVVVALGILAIGVYFIVKGARKKFLEDIVPPSGKAGRATQLTGMVGYIAKGVALIVVGILFGVAAVTSDASRTAGLDGALKSLVELPFGPVILTAVGLGFIAYGVYSFVRARRAKL
ncbi:DUF1206 domain-containing protein [Amnibacterium flavum]|uniref:DUF1206 domain-containing protein n=1 Tax=Amnibacterium flavum TaxID=2173173 RepID=A0A2V1HNI4_9MICO|nr:DUF1206 domain-containing protein [Amnibacterium flavum]PVZ94193.1 hypothetical protein DDQ50_10640 [Amnibacterium flavum]